MHGAPVWRHHPVRSGGGGGRLGVCRPESGSTRTDVSLAVWLPTGLIDQYADSLSLSRSPLALPSSTSSIFTSLLLPFLIIRFILPSSWLFCLTFSPSLCGVTPSKHYWPNPKSLPSPPPPLTPHPSPSPPLPLIYRSSLTFSTFLLHTGIQMHRMPGGGRVCI